MILPDKYFVIPLYTIISSLYDAVFKVLEEYKVDITNVTTSSNISDTARINYVTILDDHDHYAVYRKILIESIKEHLDK